MKFNTKLSCGDAAWVFFGRYSEGVQEATVRQVRIEYTDYADRVKELKEIYMCEETGVGSGTVYTYGEHIFRTREECEIKFAARIAEMKQEKADIAARQIKEKLGKEKLLRIQLAEIEELKKEIGNG